MTPQQVMERARGRGRLDAFSHVSIDSIPPGFAVFRSPWLMGLFLVAFTLISIAILSSLPTLAPLYASLLGWLTPGPPLPSDTYTFSLRLRPFFLAFFLTFSVFIPGPVGQRLKLMLTLVSSYVIAVAMLDVVLIILSPLMTPALTIVVANVTIGFVALFILAATLLLKVSLPDDDKVLTRLYRPRKYILMLLGVGVLAAVASILTSRYAGEALDDLRAIGLLGGLGPGIVLFFPLCISLLAIVETLSLRTKPGDIRGSIAFLVPAFNEADGITACIHSLDQAAQHYGRGCHLYLVDNNSWDATKVLAAAELARCKALKGKILSCLEPGKSKALNTGLRHIQEDIVIRVDADTLVDPSVLSTAMSHFADPTVGAVSGLPLPREPRHLLARMRAIEVYMNQGFGRLGLSAVDGLLSMPGVFSAYRRSCLDELGGFAEGMNGEDTDIVTRIGRLGYRLVNDPRLRVYSDVPRTLAQLREQRLRWFRSTFHVAGRNRSAIWLHQGLRGSFTLPWSLVQTVRRSMLVPVLIYAGIAAVLEPSGLFLRAGAAIVATVVGVSFLLTLAVLLIYRRFDLLPYLPAYFGFRLLRSYLCLDMLFTLPLKIPTPSRRGPWER